MHRNAPVNLMKKANVDLNKMNLKKKHLMVTYSPNFKPIENLWDILKREIYIARI